MAFFTSFFKGVISQSHSSIANDNLNDNNDDDDDNDVQPMTSVTRSTHLNANTNNNIQTNIDGQHVKIKKEEGAVDVGGSGPGLLVLAPQPQPLPHSLQHPPPPQYVTTQWQPQIAYHHQHSTIYVKEEGTVGEVNPPQHAPAPAPPYAYGPRHDARVMPPHHSGTMLHEVYGPTNAAAYIDIAGRQSHTSRQREVNPPQHAPAPAPPYAYGPRHDARVMPPPHQLPPNTSSASADSAELFRKLPESLKRIGTSESSWILTEDCCRVIGDGAAEVGFRHVLTPAENVTVHGVRGILRKKLNVHVSVHTRFSADPGEKKSSKCVVYSGDGMLIEREILSDYKCESIICKCRVKIARVNCNGISGILGYQSVDPATSHIYEHDKQAHKLFPHQELAQGLRTLSNGASKSKFSPYNLSVEQKEFITDYGLASCSTSQMKDAVSTMTYMARMNEISCTPEQLMSATKFLDAVKNWIKNKKRANDFFFLNQWGKCSMSGQDLKEVLDLLMTSPNDRTSPPDMSAYHNLHLLTPEFRETVWPYVKVHSHDHVGSTWSSITFECVHWKLLLAAAVKMYPDGTVQLEIDFFRGCAERDEWQVGQIGFSDFNHSYFLIGMDICRSENNISAGRLLDRALEMLNEVDGDCDYVLVDGGPALNLAIDNANKSRATARVKIKKRACHTHMNRLPNTRGGGKRGGNGSLPRYLLDQGVDRKTMRKIVACIFMISWIPPSDEESFIVALELLIQKFGNSLNDHVRQKYLNGDRLSLGGHMAGKPGQVASTNGMERFGGWTKTSVTLPSLSNN